MKYNRSFRWIQILSMAIAFVSVVSTQSFAISFDLTTVNENLGQPAGTIYGTVDLTQGANQVTITVTPNTAVLIPGTNFGVQSFGFNTSLTPSSLTIDDPTGWTVTSTTMDGYGSFEVVDAGNGSNRQNPLTITVDHSGILVSDLVVANSGGWLFAAHIAGFQSMAPDDKSSAFFATPVPEPATLLLLGSGLMGMGWFGRKRLKKNNRGE